MHKQLSNALPAVPMKQNLRNQRRKSRNDKVRIQNVNFEERDFILVPTVNLSVEVLKLKKLPGNNWIV
jgi:hypothetical protein